MKKHIFFLLKKILYEYFVQNFIWYGPTQSLILLLKFCWHFFAKHILQRKGFFVEEESDLPDSFILRPIDDVWIDNQVKSLPAGTSPVFYLHLIVSLGDIVALEPVPRFLKQKYPSSKIIWITKQQYVRVIQFNPYIDKILSVNELKESSSILKKLDLKNGQIPVDLHFDGLLGKEYVHHNIVNPAINIDNYLNYGNLLQAFCLCAGMKIPDMNPRFYFDKNVLLPSGLPEKYVVFHCKSNMLVKNWTKRKWNILARLLLKQGFNIVELGTEPVIKSKRKNYFDFTNIHDLQQIARIIQNASFFIGIDSGFAHIANCLDIKAVLIFGIYRNYKDYKIYSGNYGQGKNVRTVFDHKYGSWHVKVRDVEKAFCEMAKIDSLIPYDIAVKKQFLC